MFLLSMKECDKPIKPKTEHLRTVKQYIQTLEHLMVNIKGPVLKSSY